MSAVEYRSFDLPAERRPTVLVVDDEVLIRMMLCESLRQAGCEVIEAASADEALVVLATMPSPDVLVTDVRMPGALDGLELASRIRKSRPGLKVVITSGHAPARTAAGVADAFLSKPFPLEKLVDRVQALAAHG
jgi:two-component system, response regulator PdtaR